MPLEPKVKITHTLFKKDGNKNMVLEGSLIDTTGSQKGNKIGA